MHTKKSETNEENDFTEKLKELTGAYVDIYNQLDAYTSQIKVNPSEKFNPHELNELKALFDKASVLIKQVESWKEYFELWTIKNEYYDKCIRLLIKFHHLLPHLIYLTDESENWVENTCMSICKGFQLLYFHMDILDKKDILSIQDKVYWSVEVLLQNLQSGLFWPSTLGFKLDNFIIHFFEKSDMHFEKMKHLKTIFLMKIKDEYSPLETQLVIKKFKGIYSDLSSNYTKIKIVSDVDKIKYIYGNIIMCNFLLTAEYPIESTPLKISALKERAYWTKYFKTATKHREEYIYPVIPLLIEQPLSIFGTIYESGYKDNVYEVFGLLFKHLKKLFSWHEIIKNQCENDQRINLANTINTVYGFSEKLLLHFIHIIDQLGLSLEETMMQDQMLNIMMDHMDELYNEIIIFREKEEKFQKGQTINLKNKQQKSQKNSFNLIRSEEIKWENLEKRLALKAKKLEEQQLKEKLNKQEVSEEDTIEVPVSIPLDKHVITINQYLKSAQIFYSKKAHKESIIDFELARETAKLYNKVELELSALDGLISQYLIIMMDNLVYVNTILMSNIKALTPIPHAELRNLEIALKEYYIQKDYFNTLFKSYYYLSAMEIPKSIRPGIERSKEDFAKKIKELENKSQGVVENYKEFKTNKRKAIEAYLDKNKLKTKKSTNKFTYENTIFSENKFHFINLSSSLIDKDETTEVKLKLIKLKNVKQEPLTLNIPATIKLIFASLEICKGEQLLVGSFVWDLWLKQNTNTKLDPIQFKPSDIDILTSAEHEKLIGNGYMQSLKMGTLYFPNSKKNTPLLVEIFRVNSLMESLVARHLTVFALAINSNGEIINPTGLGLRDLEQRRLRLINEKDADTDEQVIAKWKAIFKDPATIWLVLKMMVKGFHGDLNLHKALMQWEPEKNANFEHINILTAKYMEKNNPEKKEELVKIVQSYGLLKKMYGINYEGSLTNAVLNLEVKLGSLESVKNENRLFNNKRVKKEVIVNRNQFERS